MTSYAAHAQAADDAYYQLHAAMMAMKHEINAMRDSQLTEDELVALLEVYNEAGR